MSFEELCRLGVQFPFGHLTKLLFWVPNRFLWLTLRRRLLLVQLPRKLTSLDKTRVLHVFPKYICHPPISCLFFEELGSVVVCLSVLLGATASTRCRCCEVMNVYGVHSVSYCVAELTLAGHDTLTQDFLNVQATRQATVFAVVSVVEILLVAGFAVSIWYAIKCQRADQCRTFPNP